MYNCLASRYAFVPHRAGLESKIVSFFSNSKNSYNLYTNMITEKLPHSATAVLFFHKILT